MLILDAGLRGAAVAIFLMVATALWRDGGRAPVARIGTLYCLSVAAYVVCSAPGFARLDLPIRLPLNAVNLGTPALFWMWAAAIFDDEFRPTWRHGLAWLGSVVLGTWLTFDPRRSGWFAYDTLALMFVGLGIWHALHGRRADLVEARRRFRVVWALIAALYIAAIVVAEFVSPGSLASAPLSIANAGGLAALSFRFAVSYLVLSHDEPIVPATAQAQSAIPDGDIRLAQRAPIADEQEAALITALADLMENEKIYRYEGVSLAMMSGKLSVPEYRLRRLVNGRLGHRNFNSFVNSYRLAEAMAALADPRQADVPILTIALDTGFQSLAPFNRAFKAKTGMTPSEFRRQRLTGLQARCAD
jgi:AraC-like DNA-binding protein